MKTAKYSAGPDLGFGSTVSVGADRSHPGSIKHTQIMNMIFTAEFLFIIFALITTPKSKE
jgi:hypothetical protein